MPLRCLFFFFFFPFLLYQCIFTLSYFLSFLLFVHRTSTFREDCLGWISFSRSKVMDDMYPTCFHILALIVRRIPSVDRPSSMPRNSQHNHLFNNSINKPEFDSIHHTLTCTSGYHDFKYRLDSIASRHPRTDIQDERNKTVGKEKKNNRKE